MQSTGVDTGRHSGVECEVHDREDLRQQCGLSIGEGEDDVYPSLEAQGGSSRSLSVTVLIQISPGRLRGWTSALTSCATPKIYHIPPLSKYSEHAPPLFRPCCTLRADVQDRVRTHGTCRERTATPLLQVGEALVRPFSLDDDCTKPARINEPSASRTRPWSDSLRNRNSNRLPTRGRADGE